MKVVMVFGAFDGLHPGHLDFFQQAKKYGDTLVVSVGTDKNVEKIKGRRAHFNQKERLSLIKQLKIVDKAVLGAEEDFYTHVRQYRPDVICLGYDQWAKEDELRGELNKVGLNNTQIVRLRPYKQDRAKSSIVKEKAVDF